MASEDKTGVGGGEGTTIEHLVPLFILIQNLKWLTL